LAHRMCQLSFDWFLQVKTHLAHRMCQLSFDWFL
jgi:hypothetical protein